MRQKTSQILYAYWNEVRGDRIAPRRFDIEPARIAHVLAETFILEPNDEDGFRFRLAGTRICEHFGRELRGTDFLSLWSAGDRNDVSRLLGEIADRGSVGVIALTASTASGREVTLEAAVLPLIHTRGRADRFLGSLSTTSSEPWLGMERLEHVRLDGIEQFWPDGRPHALVEKDGGGVPFHPSLAAGRIVRSEGRQFRVLDGGLRPDEDGTSRS